MQVQHDYLSNNPVLEKNAQRTLWVVILTAITMVAEIFYGYWTHSMALLADGWHMAAHVAALLIAYVAYRWSAHQSTAKLLNFGSGKILSLGGYTSSMLLLVMSLAVAWESIARLLHPGYLSFDMALIVAAIGLVVNLISAALLHTPHNHECDGHHDHKHFHDHNMNGAYLHVLADAFTSLAAIVSLLLAKYLAIFWLDPVAGIVTSVVVFKWGWDLLKNSAWDLLDGKVKAIDFEKIRQRIECEHVKVLDLHVWNIAPGVRACELVVESKHSHGIDHFKKILSYEFGLHHIVVEERSQDKPSQKLGC